MPDPLRLAETGFIPSNAQTHCRGRTGDLAYRNKVGFAESYNLRAENDDANRRGPEPESGTIVDGNVITPWV